MSLLFQSPRDLLAIANPGAVITTPEEESSKADREPNVYTITPNSKPQYDFVSDLSTFLVAAVGGIGSGKTFGLGFFITSHMFAEAGTGTIGGIFANTYKQLEQSTLPALWEQLEAMGMSHGEDFVYNREPPKTWTETDSKTGEVTRFRSRFRKHNGVLSVRDWGQAVVRSLENYDSIRGMTLGWAAVDELRDAKHKAFLVLLGRIRCRKARQRLIRIATSPNGFDWIYKELIINAAKMPPSAARRVIHMPTECNPDLPADYTEMLAASFTGKYAQQELKGMFVAVTEGAVYHAFNRQRHVDPTITADPRLPFHVTWDFNRNPFCVEIAQLQSTLGGYGGQRLVVIDEVVEVDIGTTEMCTKVVERIKQISGMPPGEKPAVIVYGDPAGNQRRTASNLQSDYDVIERDLPPLVASMAKKYQRETYSVIETVNATNALMARPTAFAIHPRCEQSIRDFEMVAWKKGTSDMDKTTDKSLTHTSDGIRYLIGELFPIRVPPRVRMIWT